MQASFTVYLQLNAFLDIKIEFFKNMTSRLYVFVGRLL